MLTFLENASRATLFRTCLAFVSACILVSVMGLIACSEPNRQSGLPKISTQTEKTSAEGKDHWAMERKKMVQVQIEARGVHHRATLEAVKKVERHRFVPEKQRDHAYADSPLPIGEHQTISQPYIVALMTELLEPEPGDKILEIGTGSGYQAAVLAEIVDQVYTIEIIESLGLRAKELFEELGYENIEARIGDGYVGWPEEAPFDGIIVTAAPGHIPQPLIDQLAIGARLVIPVGKQYNQRLRVLEKTPDGLKPHDDIAVRFVPMTGKAMDKD